LFIAAFACWYVSNSDDSCWIGPNTVVMYMVKAISAPGVSDPSST
jgi:hypothetical protein